MLLLPVSDLGMFVSTTFVEGASAASAIIVAVSAGIVAVIACKGLRAWREQMTGRGQYEAARRVVIAAIRIESAMASARQSLFMSTEAAGRMRETSESSEQARVLDFRYGHLMRLRPIVALIQELQEGAWECDALFPSDVAELVQTNAKLLVHCYAELHTGIEAYFDEEYQQASNPDYTPDQEYISGLKKTVYARKDDLIAASVAFAVAALKVRLLPFLR
jgi:hypothetical protein